MKQSHFATPRTMHDGTWIANAQAIHHFRQSRTESAAGVVLAVVIGILLAAALLHWYSS